MQAYETKRAAYAADITYGTNSEFGFDYLRDNMAQSLEERRPAASHDASRSSTRSTTSSSTRPARRSSSPARPSRRPTCTRSSRALARDDGRRARSRRAWTRAQKKEFVADFDYEFEEKHKTVSVTEQGVAKAEKFMGITHLYRAENGHLVNHLQQALKAESLYKRDVDYAVVDGEVKIIDEFTGRILDGRRWSEGLHQAVEAKEGVRVQEENQTLATITLQNFFRLYDKLGGMTGTALTEATEFMKIYKLPVVEVPTNRPWSARTRTIRSTRPRTASGTRWPRRSRHATTPASRCSWARSPSRSPSCCPRSCASAASRTRSSTPSPSTPSARARSSPRPAGPARSRSRRTWRAAASTSSSAATPSTSRALELAKLGLKPGDPDYDERYADILPEHRGARRAGPREGRRRPAACSSAAPSATSRAGSTTSCAAAPAARATPASRASSCPPRTTSSACSPATASTASSTASARPTRRATRSRSRRGSSRKQIEKAQRKVEEQNFLIRKRVLEYDDVMNEQRRIVYAYRDEVLEGQDMGEPAREEIAERHPPPRRGVHARRLHRGVGSRRAVRRAGRHLPARLRPGRDRRRALDRESGHRRAGRGRRRALRPRARTSSARRSCGRSSATCC